MKISECPFSHVASHIMLLLLIISKLLQEADDSRATRIPQCFLFLRKSDLNIRQSTNNNKIK